MVFYLVSALVRWDMAVAVVFCWLWVGMDCPLGFSRESIQEHQEHHLRPVKTTQDDC